MPNIDEALPELLQWNEGAGISLRDYLGAKGRSDLAYGYATVFWPEFLEHEECLFVKSMFTPQRLGLLSADCAGDLKQLQVRMNLLVPASMFFGQQEAAELERLEPVSVCRLETLGEILCETWAASARMSYPDWDIEVYTEPFDGEDADSLCLSIYRIREQD